MNNSLQRYTPHVVVFSSSLSIMIIELVASRLVAKYFGNSLFTWTGVIGVVLGGISIGNYLGGRLADRFEPNRVIIPVLLVASGTTLSILLLDAFLNRFMGNPGAAGTSAIVMRSVGVIALLFLLPATALGAISPIMAKYALIQRTVIGRTVGNIYALSSIGSIAGTFLAGFVLIPLFDLRIIVALVGAVIASLGILIQGRRIVAVGGIAAFLLLGAVALALDKPLFADESDGSVLYARFSQYSFIKVEDLYRGGRPTGERVLIMDGLVHNRHDLSDSNHLLYEYENIFEAASNVIAPTTLDKRSLRALTLGGGAMTFPSYLTRSYHPAENTVVELDPRVAAVAHRYFDVPSEPGPTVIIGDARTVASEMRGSHHYGVIYLDAFNSFSVPHHLTTVEFTRVLAELLDPNGILLVNTIDILDRGGFLTAYYNTLRKVFRSVTIYADPTVSLHGRSTFVLCASKQRSLPEVLSGPSGDPVAFALDPQVIAELHGRNGGMALSDYYSPVDNLMAPVFLRAVK